MSAVNAFAQRRIRYLPPLRSAGLGCGTVSTPQAAVLDGAQRKRLRPTGYYLVQDHPTLLHSGRHPYCRGECVPVLSCSAARATEVSGTRSRRRPGEPHRRTEVARCEYSEYRCAQRRTAAHHHSRRREGGPSGASTQSWSAVWSVARPRSTQKSRLVTNGIGELKHCRSTYLRQAGERCEPRRRTA